MPPSTSARAPDDTFDLSNELPFTVGAWKVEPASLTLSRPDAELRLEPRTVQVLVVLARSRGQVLSRAELLDQAWPDAVVGDEALTVAISKLRRALAQGDEGADFIETIPRVGYRLHEVGNGDQASPAEAGEPVVRLRHLVALGLSLGLAAVAFAAGWLGSPRAEDAHGPAQSDVLRPPEARRLTARPGLESQASLDPAGRRLVFLEVDSDRSGLTILDLQTGEESPLTSGATYNPKWSPVDQRVAFLRYEADHAVLSLISSAGGPVEEFLRVDPSPLVGLDWHPDGTRIVWSGRDTERETFAVKEIDLRTGDVRRLTRPPASDLGDARPNYSPDGRWLAFLRGKDQYSYDLWVLDTATGGERRLTQDGRRIWGFDWQDDSKRLVFSSNRTGRFQLWLMPIEPSVHGRDSVPTWIPLPDEQVRFPEVRGSEIFYDSFEVPGDLFEVSADGEVVTSPVNSKGRESCPAYSPDGTRLAYGSDRSGAAEVWIRDDDGESRRLTRLEASMLRAVGWSPDGSRLVAKVVLAGEQQVVLIDAHTGEAQRLPTPGVIADVAFGPDGRSVFFAGDAGGRFEIWRLPLPEDEVEHREGVEPIRVTEFGALAVRFGVDGTAYVLSGARPELLQREPGGSWETVLPDFLPARAFAWTVVGREIHALHSAESGDLVWKRWDPATGDSMELARLPPRLENGGFAVHPNGRTAVIGRLLPWESDLRMATARQ